SRPSPAPTEAAPHERRARADATGHGALRAPGRERTGDRRRRRHLAAPRVERARARCQEPARASAAGLLARSAVRDCRRRAVGAANERLDHMVDLLLALESGAAEEGTVDALFRDAHTIKGGASMLGLTDVRALAHAIEDLLEGVRASGDFPAGLADTLLRA